MIAAGALGLTTGALTGATGALLIAGAGALGLILGAFTFLGIDLTSSYFYSSTANEINKLPFVFKFRARGYAAFFLVASATVRDLSLPPRSLSEAAIGSSERSSYFIEVGSWLTDIDLTGVPDALV